MAFEVRLKGGEVDMVEPADSYQQEGPLTTFFQTRPGRAVIDCWARRVASYRTADIVRIRSAGGFDQVSLMEEPALLNEAC
jgi:hypothetical protein